MDIVPFLFLCFSAVLMFLTWVKEPRPRRVASLTFSLFCFIVGIILVFVSDESLIQEKTNLFIDKTDAYKQLWLSLLCGIVGYTLGWILCRRKYTRHGF